MAAHSIPGACGTSLGRGFGETNSANRGPGFQPGVIAAPEHARPDSPAHSFSETQVLRLMVLQWAQSMVADPSKVSNRKDADGNRTGWTELHEIYQVAGIRVETEEEYLKRQEEEKQKGKKIAVPAGVIAMEEFLQAPPTHDGKSWPGGMRWCGIFATWALKNAGFDLRFIPNKAICYPDGTRVPTKNVSSEGRGGELGATAGDICLVNDKSRELVDEKYNPKGYHWHHVVIASHPDDEGYFDAIEGNYTDKAGARGCIVDQDTRFEGIRRNVSELIARYELYRE